MRMSKLPAAVSRPSFPGPPTRDCSYALAPVQRPPKSVRTAKRLADRLDAPWVAVHVETAQAARMSDLDRTALYINTCASRRVSGAETVQVSGEDVSRELLQYAGCRNVTKIVVGKTDEHTSWWRPRMSSLVDRLVRDSGNIDVFVVRGVDEPVSIPAHGVERQGIPSVLPWLGTFAALTVATLVALVIHGLRFTEANLVMVYVPTVVAVAARWGAIPAAAASVMSVLLFDVLFTEPYYWITVHDTQYLVTFAVMLIVGLLAGTLTTRIRYQADVARRNERRRRPSIGSVAA